MYTLINYTIYTTITNTIIRCFSIAYLKLNTVHKHNHHISAALVSCFEYLATIRSETTAKVLTHSNFGSFNLQVILLCKFPKMDDWYWECEGFIVDDDGYVNVWVDGSCLGNGQPGARAGYGIVYDYDHFM